MSYEFSHLEIDGWAFCGNKRVTLAESNLNEVFLPCSEMI